jgi:DNA-binding response OmpR family regulator
MINLVEQVELVDVYHNGTDALNAIQKLKPDMAVLNNIILGLKKADIIQKIRKENHIVNLILLTFSMC